MARIGQPGKASSIKHEKLQAKIREMKVRLAIANEALRVESIKREQTERALEVAEKRSRSLATHVAESSAIIQRMEEEFGQALRMEEVGRIMVPALLHDLGNLVAAIRSHAQFCLSNMDFAPRMEEILQSIYEGSEKAGKLVGEFLELIRTVKFGRLEYKAINVNDAVARMWNTIRFEALLQQISFPLKLEENLPEVKGDVERLERVFLNLFVNAIQAVSEKGEVMVRTRFLPEEKIVEINVTDDGPGIPEKDRLKIFEPFFTTKPKGTGLGLTICQLIVRQHKGSLTFENGHQKGAAFSVKLPAIVECEFLKPSIDRYPCGDGAGGTDFAESSP